MDGCPTMVPVSASTPLGTSKDNTGTALVLINAINSTKGSRESRKTNARERVDHEVARLTSSSPV